MGFGEMIRFRTWKTTLKLIIDFNEKKAKMRRGSMGRSSNIAICGKMRNENRRKHFQEQLCVGFFSICFFFNSFFSFWIAGDYLKSTQTIPNIRITVLTRFEKTRVDGTSKNLSVSFHRYQNRLNPYQPKKAKPPTNYQSKTKRKVLNK